MGEMDQVKLFTVEEVNRMIPDLTDLVTEIQAKRAEIMKLEVEIDALELVTDPRGEELPPELREKVDSYNRKINGFYSLMDEIHEFGCFLKDIDLGLVDFYSQYQGRVVYLCWRLGESEVGYWHEVGRGYAHRQVLR